MVDVVVMLVICLNRPDQKNADNDDNILYDTVYGVSEIVIDTNMQFSALYSADGASFKILEHLVEGDLRLPFEYEDVLKYRTLPDSVHRHIKEPAQQEGGAINQFISTAVAEKVSAIATEGYLLRRAGTRAVQDFLIKA